MKVKRKPFFVGFVAFIFGLCLSASPVMGAGKTYIMSGKVKASETAYNTVAVEVPLGNRIFTVGGPLSPGAVLKKGGRSAQLADFTAGESVTVKWKTTDQGHLIESLEAK